MISLPTFIAYLWKMLQNKFVYAKEHFVQTLNKVLTVIELKNIVT